MQGDATYGPIDVVDEIGYGLPEGVPGRSWYAMRLFVFCIFCGGWMDRGGGNGGATRGLEKA